MSPLVSPSARPAGVAQAAKQKAADEAFIKDQAARQSLREAQSRKARQVQIEQLARREPMIRDLLEEHTALRGTCETLNREVTQLRAELAVAKPSPAPAEPAAPAASAPEPSALKPKR